MRTQRKERNIWSEPIILPRFTTPTKKRSAGGCKSSLFGFTGGDREAQITRLGQFFPCQNCSIFLGADFFAGPFDSIKVLARSWKGLFMAFRRHLSPPLMHFLTQYKGASKEEEDNSKSFYSLSPSVAKWNIYFLTFVAVVARSGNKKRVALFLPFLSLCVLQNFWYFLSPPKMRLSRENP